jgi:hypothetical protein
MTAVAVHALIAGPAQAPPPVLRHAAGGPGTQAIHLAPLASALAEAVVPVPEPGAFAEKIAARPEGPTT